MQIRTPVSLVMAVGAGQRACQNQHFRPKTCSANSIAVLRLAFQNCLQNGHKMQLSRNRFFYRKTTLSCLKARFNTKNCRNENILMKNRNPSAKKTINHSHRRKVMYKTEYPKEAILHCKVARSQKTNFISSSLPLTKFFWRAIFLTS